MRNKIWKVSVIGLIFLLGITGIVSWRSRITREKDVISELEQAVETLRANESIGSIPVNGDSAILYASVCETEEDGEFVDFLQNEEYEKAFAIRPESLSEGVSVMMAAYAAELVPVKGKEAECTALQEFGNAVIRSKKKDGDAEEYLLRLYVGSRVLLERNSQEILEGENSEQTKERNYLLMAMSSLWGSQYAFLNGTGHTYVGTELEVRDMIYDSEQYVFRFDFSDEEDSGEAADDADGGQKKGADGNPPVYTIEGSILTMPSDLAGQETIAQNQSTAEPETEEEIDEAIQDVKEGYRMDLFGSGGGYTLCIGEEQMTWILYRGIYNPNSLERLGQWQKNGLTGLDSKFTGDDIQMILEKITETTPSESESESYQETVIENAEVLVTGGDIVSMDAVDLYKAVKIVEQAVRETMGNDNWTIALYFQGGTYVTKPPI